MQNNLQIAEIPFCQDYVGMAAHPCSCLFQDFAVLVNSNQDCLFSCPCDNTLEMPTATYSTIDINSPGVSNQILQGLIKQHGNVQLSAPYMPSSTSFSEISS